MTGEILGRHPKQGRDYNIRCLDLAVDVFNHPFDETTVAGKPQYGGRQEEVMGNIFGFQDMLDGMIKGELRRAHGFNSITFSPPKDTIHDKHIGVLHTSLYPFPFDLCDDEGNTIIPYKTSVVQLDIDEVIFPPDRKVVITPAMMTESIALIADYLRDQDPETVRRENGLVYPIKYVMGLTHPRIGDVAKNRWEFHVSSHPYPGEVYDFIDESARTNKNPDYAPDIQRLRDQVLVYLPIEEFLANAPTKR